MNPTARTSPSPPNRSPLFGIGSVSPGIHLWPCTSTCPGDHTSLSAGNATAASLHHESKQQTRRRFEHVTRPQPVSQPLAPIHVKARLPPVGAAGRDDVLDPPQPQLA